MPFILEALDYEMAENAPKLRNETLSMRPSEYFKRQIYATMWFERTDLAVARRAVGEDNILFETDFPHPTCLYPDPLKIGRATTCASSPRAAQRRSSAATP